MAAKKNSEMQDGVAALFANKNPRAKEKPTQEAVLSEKPKRAPSMRTPLSISSYRGRPPKNAEKKFWSASRSYYTSNAYDKDQYEEIRSIAYKEGVPIKEILYQFIQIGLEAFKKGDFNFNYYRD